MLRLINDHKNVREISQDPFRHPIWKRFKVHGKGALGTVSGESLPAGQRVSVVHTVKRAYFLIWHFKLFRYCLKTLEHAKS